MKLLIVTQKIDVNDPILGFFHRWVEEFSKHCEKVTVICLEKGEYHLPENVKVLSLGKETFNIQHLTFNIFKKVRYSVTFLKYIWAERKNYDTVFVHMNQEYVLLGWKLWRLMGKKIMMWRNHPSGSPLTDLAVFLSDRVFCTSKYSYTARFNKTEIMPVGIDAGSFKRKPEIKKIPNSILFLGRISPIKKPDVLIGSLNLLSKEGVNFNALMIGDPLPKDQNYYQEIKDSVKRYNLSQKIVFRSGITNKETIEFYNRYEILVNLSPNGMFDKTIFEAMACESISLTSNKNLIGEVDGAFIFEENDQQDLLFKLKNILTLSIKEKEESGKELREYVLKKHGLDLLIRKIITPVK